MDTEEPELEVQDNLKQKSEKIDSNTDKKQKDGQNGEITDQMKDIEIEGEIVETISVARGTDSSYHTQYDILSKVDAVRLSMTEIQELRLELENQLGQWNEVILFLYLVYFIVLVLFMWW